MTLWRLMMGRALLFLASIFFVIGCSQHVQFNVDELVPEQNITVAMSSGQKLSGTVSAIQDESLVIVDNKGQAWQAPKNKIQSIFGPKPVVDFNGKIINEKEIEQAKGNRNFWLFTLSGGALSLGTSFFLSSMASRATADDAHNTIVYSGTAAGTLIGTWLFARAGKKRDYHQAAAAIRAKRGGSPAQTLETEKAKQQRIRKEMEELQKEREAQEAELKRLREKILKK
jgi:hypothetical protein